MLARHVLHLSVLIDIVRFEVTISREVRTALRVMPRWHTASLPLPWLRLLSLLLLEIGVVCVLFLVIELDL